MNFTRQNLVNASIAAVAVLLFGAFLWLAEGGDDPGGDELDAIAQQTTTTARRATTTTPSTSTTLGPSPTTTSRLSTPTTARTATTRRATSSNTTQRPTTATTASSTPSGPANERSDNNASFTHGQDGSFSVAATDPPGGSDPFRFVIRTSQGSGGVSGDTASVKFTVTLTNNTARSISFPGGLKVVVTMRTPGGGDLQFNMTASDVHNIVSGETITISQERAVSGYGTFDATATCDVDYG